MKNTKLITYSTWWRNKWITSEAQSISDMINAYEENLKFLKQMKREGIEGNFDAAGDDYISFTTTDPLIAKEYGFQVEEEDESSDE